jgi:hypothetical protein
MARTAKDEREFDAELRREEGIKTEVIMELREQNRQLWQSQVNLLRSLLLAEGALAVYRQHALVGAERAVKAEGDCVPGCVRHRWDDKDGWRRPVDPA